MLESEHNESSILLQKIMNDFEKEGMKDELARAIAENALPPGFNFDGQFLTDWELDEMCTALSRALEFSGTEDSILILKESQTYNGYVFFPSETVANEDFRRVEGFDEFGQPIASQKAYVVLPNTTCIRLQCVDYDTFSGEAGVANIPPAWIKSRWATEEFKSVVSNILGADIVAAVTDTMHTRIAEYLAIIDTSDPIAVQAFIKENLPPLANVRWQTLEAAKPLIMPSFSVA